MRRLRDVYESARKAIPAGDLPHRGSILPWDDLDTQVRDELETLQSNIFATVKDTTRLLASHQRVIGIYNRGLRHGFFNGPTADRDRDLIGQQPFLWGVEHGQRARVARSMGEEAELFPQFITATHLLAWEFGELEQALASPFDFVVRSVGPKHLRDFGELVFALPVLLNYRRSLVRQVTTGGFDFQSFYALLPFAPSHMDYLEHGLVALFDPSPDSWVKVAANMELAIRPFGNGHTLLSDHHNAPVPAAATIAAKPITACNLIGNQMRRIELARDWLGVITHGIGLMDEVQEQDATLWDVYRLCPRAMIRGGDERPGDIVAFEALRALSVHFDQLEDSGDTCFAFLRRHLPAFANGFDDRFEAAIDPRAVRSVRAGREVGDGLRRFEDATSYVDALHDTLVEVDRTVRELERAAGNPVDYVQERLKANRESPAAVELYELFERYSHLAAELFQPRPSFDFFSTTTVQTGSGYDMLRAALFHAVQAAGPQVRTEDERLAHLAESRRALEGLLERSRMRPPPRQRPQTRTRSVVLTKSNEKEELDERFRLVDHARVFLAEFEAMSRILRQLVGPLQVAFRLARRRPERVVAEEPQEDSELAPG